MMKHLIFLLILIDGFVVSGQTWIENNAVWHYDYWNIAQGGFYKLEYSQDTLLGGISSQEINVYRSAFGQAGPGGPIVQFGGPALIRTEYTYVSGDTVFRWDENQYRVLFDFAAQPGDSWIISTKTSPIELSCGDTASVLVTNAGIEMINGINYRFIELETMGDSQWGLDGHFNERFGGLSYPFPIERNCDPMIIVEWDYLTFKCYEDDLFALYNPSGEDCEYLLTHLGISPEAYFNGLSIYPVPATSDIRIFNEFAIQKVELYSLNGALLTSIADESGIVNVPIAELKPGVYFLHMSAGENSIIRSFIKE